MIGHGMAPKIFWVRNSGQGLFPVQLTGRGTNLKPDGGLVRQKTITKKVRDAAKRRQITV
jgi:hypothetical protein